MMLTQKMKYLPAVRAVPNYDPKLPKKSVRETLCNIALTTRQDLVLIAWIIENIQELSHLTNYGLDLKHRNLQ